MVTFSKQFRIIVLGARLDGHAGVVLDIVKQYSLGQIVGFVDDNPLVQNTLIQGIPVLGNLQDFVSRIPPETDGFFIASGDNKFRERCFKLLKEQGYSLVNIIHPTAVLSPNTKIGEGVFIGPNVVINNNAVIGDGVLINTAATIDHDNIIEDFVNVSPGSHTSGRVRVKRGAFLGTGVSTVPDITIGEYAVVGAGAVVIKNVPAQTTVAGVPAVPLHDAVLLKTKEAKEER